MSAHAHGSDGHMCPGCGTCTIPRARLSCRSCWYRLPQTHRNAIWATYSDGTGAGSIPHLRAVSAALGWYRSNPIGVK